MEIFNQVRYANGLPDQLIARSLLTEDQVKEFVNLLLQDRDPRLIIGILLVILNEPTMTIPQLDLGWPTNWRRSCLVEAIDQLAIAYLTIDQTYIVRGCSSVKDKYPFYLKRWQKTFVPHKEYIQQLIEQECSIDDLDKINSYRNRILSRIQRIKS